MLQVSVLNMIVCRFMSHKTLYNWKYYWKKKKNNKNKGFQNDPVDDKLLSRLPKKTLLYYLDKNYSLFTHKIYEISG